MTIMIMIDMTTVMMITTMMNKKLGYRRDSARCGWCNSTSFKVIRCCANRRGIYMSSY